MPSMQGVIELYRVPRVAYGLTAAQALRDEVERLDARRVCLIVSETLREKTDEITHIEALLDERHAVTVSGVVAHVPESSVLDIAATIRRYDPDLLVSVGGGSANDTTKAVLICLEHDITSIAVLDRYRLDWSDGRTQAGSFAPPRIPMIAIPTTLSSSEYAPMGGVTNEASGVKRVFGHRQLRVEAVILDPAITRHTPLWLWLSTGVKAVDHAAETLGSLRSNDFCDGLAASALGLLNEGLRVTKADPEDLAARLKCQLASWQACMPLAHTPMGLSHALAYVLGTYFNIPHGYSSCVTLPAVMAWNAAANSSRQHRISEVLGSPGVTASKALLALIKELGMPTQLRAVGVDETRLALIAEKAIDGKYIPSNPRPILSPKDIVDVLKLAT